MPTINQLVRKPRKAKMDKSDSPALNKGYNSFKKAATNTSSPQKRGVCTRVGTMTPKNLTQRYVNMLVYVCLTCLKLQLISQVSDITYKNIVLFLFVVDVLKIYQGFVIT